MKSAGLGPEDLAPLTQALARGEADLARFATDAVLRRCSVVAGTPEECAETLGTLAAARVTLPLLEVRGESEEEKAEAIRLLAREVAPRLQKIWRW